MKIRTEKPKKDKGMGKRLIIIVVGSLLFAALVSTVGGAIISEEAPIPPSERPRETIPSLTVPPPLGTEPPPAP